MNYLTETEVRRTDIHEKICHDFQEIRQKEDFSTSRIIRGIAKKYGFTEMGIRSILKKKGVYTIIKN